MNRHALAACRTSLGACVLALVAFPTLAIADTGDLVHMTISGKVQMTSPPMSIAIPSISRDVCSPKQIDVRALVNQTSRNKNCTYSNYSQVGGTVSFHYVCTDEKMQLDGDGSFTVTATGVQGTIHANSSMHGQATVVDMTYEGTRTGGSCDYTPPKTSP